MLEIKQCIAQQVSDWENLPALQQWNRNQRPKIWIDMATYGI